LAIDASEYPVPPTDTDLYLVEAPRMEQLLGSQDSEPLSPSVPERGPAAPFPIPILVFGQAELLPRAFSLGCADFLTEPWDYPELKARALRSVPPPILCAAGRWYCLRERGLSLMSGMSGSKAGVPTALKLSYYEAAILRLLLINRSKPVYRETIQYALWGERRRESRAVDMHITSLRKKIHRLYVEGEKAEERILSVRNVGYRFV